MGSEGHISREEKTQSFKMVFFFSFHKLYFHFHLFAKYIAVLLSFFLQLMLYRCSHCFAFGKTSYVSSSPNNTSFQSKNHRLWCREKNCFFKMMWLLINKTVCLHPVNAERLVMNSQLRQSIDASAKLPSFICTICSSRHSK